MQFTNQNLNISKTHNKKLRSKIFITTSFVSHHASQICPTPTPFRRIPLTPAETLTREALRGYRTVEEVLERLEGKEVERQQKCWTWTPDCWPISNLGYQSGPIILRPCSIRRISVCFEGLSPRCRNQSQSGVLLGLVVGTWPMCPSRSTHVSVRNWTRWRKRLRVGLRTYLLPKELEDLFGLEIVG